MNVDINFIVSSLMPYHLDRFNSLDRSFICNSISEFEKDYFEIQKSHFNSLENTESKNIKIHNKEKKYEDLNFFQEGVALIKSILFSPGKVIIIGLGGNLKPYNPVLFFSVILRRLLGKKIFILFNTNYSDRERLVYKELLKLLLLSIYSGAMCSSPSSASYLKFLGFKKRKVIPGGFNTISNSRFNTQIERSSRNQFLYVGRLSEKKNINFLLDVYKEYCETNPKALDLKLIGHISEHSPYVNHALNIGLDKNIFLGALDDKAIVKELYKSKALLIPSKYEEWGNVVNEAVATSTPLLVSDNVIARKVLVRQFVNGIILESDNHKGWLHALNELTDNEKLASQLSEGSKRFLTLTDTKWFKKSMNQLLE